MAAEFISFLLDCLAPRVCAACEGELGLLSENRDAIPPPGWPAATVEFLETDFRMPLLGAVSLAANPLCRACWLTLEPCRAAGMLRSPREGAPAIPVIAPFHTSDALLALVRFLKFGGGRSAVAPLAWWMAQSLRTQWGMGALTAGPSGAVLVPVPLHRARERERGYNQAALLAAAAASHLGLETVEGAVVRARKTKAQSTIDSPSDRAANLSGAFRLARSESVRDRRVLLVDDLVTTGATARACVEALLEASPAAIAVLACGRTRELPYDPQ